VPAPGCRFLGLGRRRYDGAKRRYPASLVDNGDYRQCDLGRQGKLMALVNSAAQKHMFSFQWRPAGKKQNHSPLINPQHGRPQGLRPDDLAVVKTSGVLSCEWVKGRISSKWWDRTLEVFNEQTSQVTAQAEAGHEPVGRPSRCD